MPLEASRVLKGKGGGGYNSSGAWVRRHTPVASHGSSSQQKSHKISPPNLSSKLYESRPLRGDNGGYKRGGKFSVCEGFLSENHYTSSSDKYAERSRGGYSDNIGYSTNCDRSYSNDFDLITTSSPVTSNSDQLFSFCDNRRVLKGTFFFCLEEKLL